MPSAVASHARATSPDELDDLFNYDAGMDQVLNSSAADAIVPQPRVREMSQNLDGNMDEEVKITKKRQPVAKLDEARLLSNAGIPKLRKISKSLRFKGKGHEFSDMARLLNTYQLWLDDMFPKAKFADGLALIEKVGHKKRMQIIRKGWMDEGKSKGTDHLDEVDMTVEDEERLEAQQDRAGHDEPVVARIGPNDINSASGIVPPNVGNTVAEEPEEDELDALLAESAPENLTQGYQSMFGSGIPAKSLDAQQPPADDFADEEDAMAGMDW